MSDEIRPEDEVEAHGAPAMGPDAAFAEGSTVGAADDQEPDVEAHGLLTEAPNVAAPNVAAPNVE